MANSDLNAAKKAKKDEFYTQLSDIQEEVRHYKEHFRGKTVDYPKYDNYDAIEVGKVADIPVDYDGLMGVPVTFLDKYNPSQFEIVGDDISLGASKGRFYVNGRRLFSRIVIRRKITA